MHHTRTSPLDQAGQRFPAGHANWYRAETRKILSMATDAGMDPQQCFDLILEDIAFTSEPRFGPYQTETFIAGLQRAWSELHPRDAGGREA
jgi:hypothetical protein